MEGQSPNTEAPWDIIKRQIREEEKWKIEDSINMDEKSKQQLTAHPIVDTDDGKSLVWSRNVPGLKEALKYVFEYIGDDPFREGLQETPNRIIKSWKELFSGYGKDPQDILKTFEDGACDEMVILEGIDFFSTCEHHFLPFYGNVSIGYVPNGKVIGVSKLARLVEIFSRRLQIQEKMTTQIATALQDALNPKGVMVVCKAKHLCMVARGVKKANPEMITSSVIGAFRDDQEARNEFLRLTSAV